MEWSLIFTEEVQRVLIAALLGGIIGLEREWSGKPAGLRTLMLVCAGSALFMVVSYEVADLDMFGTTDVSRIASNIVTGIGFIGAGIIFKGRNNVHGLTTAATVWMSAAIGMTVGAGSYILAISSTVLVWIILVVLQWVEDRLARVSETLTYKVSYLRTGENSMPGYEKYFRGKAYKLRGTTYEKHDGLTTLSWKVSASGKNHAKAIELLIADEQIAGFAYS